MFAEGPRDRTCFTSGVIDFCLVHKDKFTKGVNELIKWSERSDSKLDSFRVCFCLGKNSSSDIDSWIRFAISKGVRSLQILLSREGNYYGEAITRSYIFRAELTIGSKIRELSLKACTLEQGFFAKLCTLTSCRLSAVSLPDTEVESILSCCSNLEFLSFWECNLPDHLCVSGSDLKLKVLTVLCCGEIEVIELAATNLTSFTCVNREMFLRTHIFQSELLTGSMMIELSLQTCTLRQDFFAELHNLKDCSLRSVNFPAGEVESILSCCPNLEFLSFWDCNLPFNYHISRSDLKLEVLKVEYCHGVSMMEFYAPNLTEFTYYGYPIFFSFLEVSNLKVAAIGEDQRYPGFIMDQLLIKFPSVKDLDLTLVATPHWVLLTFTS